MKRVQLAQAGCIFFYAFLEFLEIKKINDKEYEKYDMIVAEVSLT